MKITGLAQTVAPIHITASTDGTITKGNETQIVTYPIFEYENGKQAHLPGISATHLRGSLRRIASDIYNQRYREAGVAIPAALMNAQRHGATGGVPDTQARKGDDYVAQMKDPFMACFGGGPKMLPGHVAAPWALPLSQEAVAINLFDVPSYLEEEKLPTRWQLVASGTAYSKIDMMNGLSISDIIADYAETVAQILAANEDRKARKGSEEKAPDADKRRSSNILSYQYLIPGTLLYFHLHMDDELSDAAKGLFIEAVRRFFEIGKVGGMQRIGFGLEAFNLRTVSEFQCDGMPIFREVDGKLKIDPGASKAVQNAVAAFDAWLIDPEAIDLDLLHRAAGLETPGKKKKAA